MAVSVVFFTLLEFLEGVWDSVLAGRTPDVMNITIVNMNMISVERLPGEEVSPRK
jgi:hypothetical protein